VADALELTGSREKACEDVANRAWSAYFAGDIATAGRGFNQAYLIAPERSGVYHAFAVLIQTRYNDSDYADELFRIALKQPDPSKRLRQQNGNDAGACAAAAEAGRQAPVADVQADLQVLKRLAKCD
jgi:hypothetical protein